MDQAFSLACCFLFPSCFPTLLLHLVSSCLLFSSFLPLRLLLPAIVCSCILPLASCSFSCFLASCSIFCHLASCFLASCSFACPLFSAALPLLSAGVGGYFKHIIWYTYIYTVNMFGRFKATFFLTHHLAARTLEGLCLFRPPERHWLPCVAWQQGLGRCTSSDKTWGEELTRNS